MTTPIEVSFIDYQAYIDDYDYLDFDTLEEAVEWGKTRTGEHVDYREIHHLVIKQEGEN